MRRLPCKEAVYFSLLERNYTGKGKYVSVALSLERGLEMTELLGKD